MANNQPVGWSYGAVAFLDILGFSSLVEEDARSASPIHLERIIDSLRDAKASESAKELDLRAFSDSIVISAALTPTAIHSLFLAVMALQRSFISKGVLIRGGIAFGKHYAGPDAIYSEALISAYKLERDKARFPRILIDTNLLDWFLNDPATTVELKESAKKHLLRDRDEFVFLSYLEKEGIHSHLALLQTYSVKSVSPSVLEKLQWLAGYHNYSTERFGSNDFIGGALVPAFGPV